MTIKFEDGSSIDADDWSRMLSIVKQRAKEGKPKPTELVSADGVTIKVKGYEVKANGKGPDYANFIEIKHKNCIDQEWTVRVWRNEAEQIYGCNYYLVEDVRYFECRFQDVKDENAIFTHICQVIDGI